jgi:hypothetical protein
VITKKPHIKLFPIYNGLCSKDEYEKKYIIFVGYFVAEYVDADFVEFIKKIKNKYKLIIFSYTDCNFLNNYDNIEHHRNAKIKTILHYMNQSKFMLCRKMPYMNTDRFSGALSLGLSHNIPLILNDFVAKDNEIEYGCMTFKNNYNEITQQIINMTDDQYDAIIENIKINKQLTIQKNITNINDFFEKYII